MNRREALMAALALPLAGMVKVNPSPKAVLLDDSWRISITNEVTPREILHCARSVYLQPWQMGTMTPNEIRVITGPDFGCVHWEKKE